MKSVDAREVLARVKVQEDTVTMEQARLQVFGGSVDAPGPPSSWPTPTSRSRWSPG